MIRAGVDDAPMARVVGIRVSRLFTIVFCLGAWLAGFAGVIGGPILSVYPGLDGEMLPLALVVVILGGSGSLSGALVGQLRRRLPLQLRPGDVPGARLRRAVPAHADRARGAAAGTLRTARGVKRARARARRSCVLATVPLWVSGTFYVNIASQILFYAIFALGVNVLAGYAGLVSPRPRRALRHRRLHGREAAHRRPRPLAADAARARGDHARGARVFAVLALRGTGLGFVMITVALGQIVWGVAYRWISLTNGDNGITITGRPSPFGLVAHHAARLLLGDARRLPARARVDGRSSWPRRSARRCAARGISRGA